MLQATSFFPRVNHAKVIGCVDQLCDKRGDIYTGTVLATGH